jgi:tetratricopeptide (TPR) repeat protein
MQTMSSFPALLAALMIAGCSAAPTRDFFERSPAPPQAAAASAALQVDDSAPVNEQGDAELVAAPGLITNFNRYARGEFEEAADVFNAVLEAPSIHTKAEVAAAEYFLAKALARLGYRVASLSFFENIALDPSHPYQPRTLFWLARLANDLPDDEAVLRLMSRYPPARLDSGAPPQPPGLVESARYYLGRAHYQKQDFNQAIRLLHGIPAGSRWAVYARFFEGVSHLRSADPDAAASSFEIAVREAERAPGVEPSEAARLRDLAWISLARVHYSRAKSEGSELSLTGGEALRLALEAYEHVGDEGGFHDDALLEQAWALVRLGDTRRALASLDALSPPYVETSPEVHYLRSYIHFARCEVDKAAATIDAFRQTYGRAAVEVERLGREAAAKNPSSTRVSPAFHAVVTSALAQRDVRRIFELLSMIKKEKELLAAAPARFQSSPVGARLFQELEDASTAASERISESVKKRCDRFAEESREELANAAKIGLEIEAIRGGLTKCSPSKKAPPR